MRTARRLRDALAALAALAVAAGPAAARPLPRGMTASVKDGRPMITQGGVTVPLLDDEHAGIDDHPDVSLSDDGKAIHLVWGRCGQTGDERDELDVPLGHVTARVENLAGMALHLKKKYADAIPHFAAAAAAYPELPMYATNLLSAQAMGGKLDDADQTIATYGPKNPGWLAWRLAVDSDLAALRKRPAAAPYTAARPGKARVAKLDGTMVAVSALGGGLVAMLGYDGNGGPGSPVGRDLVVYDLAADRVAMRLPVEAMEDACLDKPAKPGADGDDDGGEPYLAPCTAKQRASTAKHRKAADALLAALGFELAPGAMAEVPLDGEAKVSSPDGKTTVAATPDKLVITRGGKSMTVDRDVRIDEVVFAGDRVLLEWSERHVYYCDDDSFRTGLMAAQPSAP